MVPLSVASMIIGRDSNSGRKAKATAVFLTGLNFIQFVVISLPNFSSFSLSALSQDFLVKKGTSSIREPFGFCLRTCPISRLEARMGQRDACKEEKSH